MKRLHTNSGLVRRWRPAAALFLSLMNARDPASAQVATEPSSIAATPNAANTLAPQPAAAEKPLTIVISGAVSLGSYEAGVLYYLTEALKVEGAPATLDIATGASAGSANALVALLSRCSAAVQRPQDSTFWRVWIPPGINELFVPQAAGGRAALSRKFLHESWQIIESDFERGLPKECDVVLGVTATRAAPIRVPLSHHGLDVPRMSEKFVVRMQGRGNGKQPTLVNYVDATSAAQPAILQTSESGQVELDALRDALFASAAFPLAFEPQRVSHCLAGGGSPLTCNPATRNDEFVDGGLLDNQPLRLAVDTAYQGLDPSGGWRAQPSSVQPGHSDVEFVYVTPSATIYPSVQSDENAAEPWVSLVKTLAQGVVETARSKELLMLAEPRPEIRNSLDTVESYYPKSSELFGAFLGFFDRGFREFDFYLGMYDAYRFLKRRYPS